MLPENKILNGLWVEGKLTSLETVTILSAQEMGHEFHLWTYNPAINAPKGTVIRNAEEVIPFAGVFKKEKNDPTNGLGKGSYGAPFSDLFRYKLLMLQGGWWVDMDITFIKPLDISKPYFFRHHPSLNAIGNVIKVPAGSELMKNTYNEANEACTKDTADWLLPNRILNKNIKALKLEKYIRQNISNSDLWSQTRKYVYTSLSPDKDWHLIHWMNEEWRRFGIDRNIYIKNSFYGNNLVKYGQPLSNAGLLKRSRHSFSQGYIMDGLRKIMLTFKRALTK